MSRSRELRPDHLELLLDKLTDAGANIELTDEGLRVRQEERPRAVDFVTLPYPGLATDFQPIMMAALAVAGWHQHRHGERLRAPVPLRR